MLKKSLADHFSPAQRWWCWPQQSHTLVDALGKANTNNNAKKATTCQPVFIEKVQASAVNHSLLILTYCLAQLLSAAPCQSKARNIYYPAVCYSTTTVQKICSFMESSVSLWLCMGHTRACNMAAGAAIWSFASSKHPPAESTILLGC